MKIKTLLLICIIISTFLLGCTQEKIVYVNQTIVEKVPVEVVKKVVEEKIIEKECPKVEDDCSKKLNLCHIRLDEMNDHLYEYMMANNSQHYENLSFQYKSLKRNYTRLEHKINNITYILEGMS